MRLTLGFSTCPNDTFAFDAMLHGKVDTAGLSFDVIMADVEELNQRALKTDIDITKLSFHAFAKVSGNYLLLNSGSALGSSNGPLLISKNDLTGTELSEINVALPGEHTTAHLLFSLFFPQVTQKHFMVFSDIENAVLNGDVDAGVIIHENRFTYQLKGLKLIRDLGQAWETKTGLPIPLGGIAIRKSIPLDIQQLFDRVLRNSIEFALENPESSFSFVKSCAQEMEPDVLRKHIELYVNQFTVNLGPTGRNAISTLIKNTRAENNSLETPVDYFVPVCEI